MIISSMQLSADYTRTYIPFEEGTGKYNLKVRATPALVRLAKGRFAQLKSPILVPLHQTCLASWTVRRNACGQLITFMSLPYPLRRFWLLHSLSGGACPYGARVTVILVTPLR